MLGWRQRLERPQGDVRKASVIEVDGAPAFFDKRAEPLENADGMPLVVREPHGRSNYGVQPMLMSATFLPPFTFSAA